jgi:AraC-like DNA-binding protein
MPRKVNEIMKNKTNWSFWIFVAIVTFVYFYDNREDFVKGFIEGFDAARNEELSNQIIYVAIFLFILFISLFTFILIRSKRYEKRFDELVLQSNDELTDNYTKGKTKDLEGNKPGNSNSDINKSLVESILIKLDEFEKTMRYTNNHYTLNKLANELETNSTYLSKIINDYKNQNFPNYLKELRVSLAIYRLKNESKFGTFTIQAIAEEIGFKTAQSFSKAFHEKNRD